MVFEGNRKFELGKLKFDEGKFIVFGGKLKFRDGVLKELFGNRIGAEVEPPAVFRLPFAGVRFCAKPVDVIASANPTAKK